MVCRTTDIISPKTDRIESFSQISMYLIICYSHHHIKNTILLPLKWRKFDRSIHVLIFHPAKYSYMYERFMQYIKWESSFVKPAAPGFLPKLIPKKISLIPENFSIFKRKCLNTFFPIWIFCLNENPTKTKVECMVCLRK